MMSGKLLKDVEKLEKDLEKAVDDMNDMNKLMEQTLEFFSSGQRVETQKQLVGSFRIVDPPYTEFTFLGWSELLNGAEMFLSL